jgi:GntR family transcriptional regulator, transcriptional repressor for pyruvate dehydrogenase complex
MNKPAFGFLPAAATRTTQVAEWFAREIRSGRLKGGEQLPTEQQLIAQFQVSRTVIREAMASLRSDGLVVSRQGSGVYVADQTVNTGFRIIPEEVRSLIEVQNILQLRLAVEVEAAGAAAAKRSLDDLEQMRQGLQEIDAAIAAGESAVKLDFAFHRAISVATGNPYFERFMYFLGPVMIPRQSIKSRKTTADQQRQYLERVQGEHWKIYHAIERQDVEGARNALREHLDMGRMGYMKEYPTS